MTLGAIETVMNRWRKTGEYGGGAFFQCSDLVIVPKGGVAAMVDASRAIVVEVTGGSRESGVARFRPSEGWKGWSGMVVTRQGPSSLTGR